MKKALVLEGGGSRGIYTAGVLEVFHSSDLDFNYVIGTSMGACNGASYVSNQPKRNKRTIVDYINDDRYFNYLNIVRKNRSVFGMDFLFDTVPNELDPFDYDTFHKSEIIFNAVATDMETGKGVYFSKDESKNKNDIMNMIKASSSLPVLAEPVHFDNKKLLDGGVADSIPLQKAIEDGAEKIVVVLTRDKKYRKKQIKGKWFYKRKFKNYPEFINAVSNRHVKYNETLDLIDKLEKEEKIVVIRPSEPINISKFEKNLEVFDKIHRLGINDAKNKIEKLKKYLNF